jgi:quercetin dioxygenase-like cupin family protein
MRKRTATIIVLGVVATSVAAVALATPPSGLTSELLGRGNAGTFRVHDESLGLKLRARQPTDIAVVRARLENGGTTGWHRHPGPSLVVVKSGTVTMVEPTGRHRHGRQCSVQDFGPGRAFVHPAHEHTFENRTDAPVELYVVYFVAQGAAPLLTDVPKAPESCA